MNPANLYKDGILFWAFFVVSEGDGVEYEAAQSQIPPFPVLYILKYSVQPIPSTGPSEWINLEYFLPLELLEFHHLLNKDRVSLFTPFSNLFPFPFPNFLFTSTILDKQHDVIISVNYFWKERVLKVLGKKMHSWILELRFGYKHMAKNNKSYTTMKHILTICSTPRRNNSRVSLKVFYEYYNQSLLPERCSRKTDFVMVSED